MKIEELKNNLIKLGLEKPTIKAQELIDTAEMQDAHEDYMNYLEEQARCGQL